MTRPIEIEGAQFTPYELGASIAASGDVVLVGAPSREYAGRIADAEAVLAPCACVMARDDAGWRLAATLEASDPLAAEGFARSVALTPAVAAIGAPGHENGDAAIQVYARIAGPGLRPTRELDAPERSQPHDDVFSGYGAAVALDDRVVVVGAPLAGDDGEGAVYLLDPNGDRARGGMVRGPWPHAGLGTAIALVGDTLVIGADAAYSNAQLAGACLVYRRDPAGTWRPHCRVDGRVSGEQFGAAVATDGVRFVVGAPGRADLDPAARARVDVFELTADGCRRIAELSDTASFGAAIALAGDRIAIGQPMAGGAGVVQTGRIGLYRITADGAVTGATWLDPPAPRPYGRLGSALAFGPDYLAAGMPGLGLGGSDGSVVIYPA